MTNREKYAKEIKNFNGEDFCKEFVKPNVLHKIECYGITCEQCQMIRVLWLDEEYDEPEPQVDWSKVPVDTKILVRDSEKEEWRKMYFAKYKDGKVWAWAAGNTSWSAIESNDYCSWKYAKLYDGGE